MTDQLPETPHFSFTRVGSGESVSKNGYSLQDLDVLKLDKLFYAAFNHRHDNIPSLGDPTDSPDLSASGTGGQLPAATTYYYKVSYIDEFGLETAASPEDSVTTPNPIPPPTPPAASVLTTGGTMTPGVYSYLITFQDQFGGETTPSAINNVQVVNGTTNKVQLDLPTSSDPDFVGWGIYRARPGQNQFYQLGTTTTSPYYDTGASEDQTITAPTVNSTHAFNSITVTIPGGFIPDQCASWKIYRTTSSGNYDGASLVHHVIEPATTGSPIPVTSWLDDGDPLLQGFPLNSTSVVPPSPLLTLDQVQGTLPLTSIPRGASVLTVYRRAAPTNGGVISVTETPNGMKPVRMTAHFQTPPTSETVTIVASDGTNTVSLVCSTGTHQGGDNAGYWHTEWPLIEAKTMEAEDLTISTFTADVVEDVTASGGQAVDLIVQNDYVLIDCGVLDAGSYHSFGTVRCTNVAASSTNDLKIEVIRTDTSAVLGTASFTLTSADPYAELTGPTFTAPGGIDVAIKVSKTLATAQTYNVDKVRFTADVPSLNAGTLTITTTTTGTVSAADVNLAIWF